MTVYEQGKKRSICSAKSNRLFCGGRWKRGGNPLISDREPLESAKEDREPRFAELPEKRKKTVTIASEDVELVIEPWEVSNNCSNTAEGVQLTRLLQKNKKCTPPFPIGSLRDRACRSVQSRGRPVRRGKNPMFT